MTFIRISDVPPDELYLLPIVGLWQQIEEDRNRPGMPGADFVTDWQLQPHAAAGSSPPANRVDADVDEDSDEDFDNQDVDPGTDDDPHEDSDDPRHTGGRLASVP